MLEFLIAAAMCLVFSLFVALFHKIGENIDNKNRRLDKIAGKSKGIVDEELGVPFFKRFLVPTFNGMIKSFSRLLPRKEKKESSRLEKNLILAGLRITPSEFTAIRFVYIFGTLFITIMLIVFLQISIIFKLLIYFVGVALAIGGPIFYLSFRIKSRQEAIRHQLPEILDLLTVSVEAGLSFDAALLYIEQFSFGPLVDELTILKKDIQMGLPRREALKKLAERNSVEELKTLAGALVQSDQIGVPIRNVLRVQSAQLRLSRKQAAEEKAMKAPVKIILPLVAFIFPVTFIILLGPTAMKLIEVFGK